MFACLFVSLQAGKLRPFKVTMQLDRLSGEPSNGTVVIEIRPEYSPPPGPPLPPLPPFPSHPSTRSAVSPARPGPAVAFHGVV